jgi:hypothetical protein
LAYHYLKKKAGVAVKTGQAFVEMHGFMGVWMGEA